MKPIDIFITAYSRQEYTLKTIEYLKARTKYPYRLFLIDQGETNLTAKDQVDYYIGLSKNVGIHCAWNIALSMAESKYFITSDNDIYVPDLIHKFFSPELFFTKDSPEEQPCWLERVIKYMDYRPDYGAISLHPHVLIGGASFDFNDPEDVKEVGHCGAVMRIMRRSAVWKSGGWENKIEVGRNHEELTICSRLKTVGYKLGRTTRIRAYHPFGKNQGGNWGYPKDFTPEMQKHNPDLEQYVQQFDNPDAYDPKTWLPK